MESHAKHINNGAEGDSSSLKLCAIACNAEFSLVFGRWINTGCDFYCTQQY